MNALYLCNVAQRCRVNQCSALIWCACLAEPLGDQSLQLTDHKAIDKANVGS